MPRERRGARRAPCGEFLLKDWLNQWDASAMMLGCSSDGGDDDGSMPGSIRGSIR